MTPNNPSEILVTLDCELDHDVSLVLYGRAALCLGFSQSPPAFQATQDVDAIISISQLPLLTNDLQFWEAIDSTNHILSPKGLYITHLFAEDQVFLRPDWENFIVPIHSPQTRFLKLFRPHVIDLILTKMMRGNDALDMDDIRFLANTEKVTMPELENAFISVRMPQDIPELKEAFQRAIPTVREIVASSTRKESVRQSPSD
jgi:hypothetical protein